MSDFVEKNWNPETFSSFNCYFDYLDDQTVSFHFQDERIVIKLVDDNIKVTESALKSVPHPELVKISELFGQSK